VEPSARREATLRAALGAVEAELELVSQIESAQRERADVLLDGYTRTQEQAHELWKNQKAPVWARGLTVLWAVIVGVLIGGSVVPHVDDAPQVVQAVAALPADPGHPPMVERDREMTLSWAGVRGATEYKVALYRDGVSVVSRTVTTPSTRVKLSRGTYHWVVWPVIGGVEQRATVSSELIAG